MSLERFFTTPLTIIEPGVKIDDRYGNEVPDWDDPRASTDLFGWVRIHTGLRGAKETATGGRDVTITLLDLVLPADAPLTAACRVVLDPGQYEVDERTFEMDGIPRNASTPNGPHHVEALLKLVEG